MNSQEPLFEVISDDEYAKAQETSQPTDKTKETKSKWNTDIRTQTNWFKFPTHMGFCTVPMHAEVQRAIYGEAREYRQQYPSRMVFTIDEFDVCRDCFLVEADKESVTDDHGTN